MYMKMSNYVAGAVGGNRGLLSLPPVKIYDIIVARVIVEGSTYLFVSFIMFVALVLLGVSDAIPHDPLTMMAALALAILLGIGVGMVNIVFSSYIPNWMF